MNNQQIFANSSEQPQINILWTGGFDSSSRMVQLSKYKVTTQPYYIIENRLSEQNELKAIADITSDIENHPDTKCTILPLIKLKIHDIELDRTITEAYQKLAKITCIGPQYEWLGRFATTVQGLELCLERSEMGLAYNCIIKNGKLKKINDEALTYYIIDKEKSSGDLIKVFGAYHFPCPLFEITKLETLEEYKKLGFGETIDKTWFCHLPVNSKPCGLCNPCKAAIKEGLSFRIPKSGLRRHKLEQKYGNSNWYKVYKRIWFRIVYKNFGGLSKAVLRIMSN